MTQVSFAALCRTRVGALALGCASLLMLVVLPLSAGAQGSAARSQATAIKTGAGPGWSELSAEQRTTLAPLQKDWATIDATRKQKWLEVATRFPKMPADERARMQARMADWARMSPRERGEARLGYQQAQGITPQERQAKWAAYQALPADQRRQLAVGAARSAEPPRRADARPAREGAQQKSNIVPNPNFAAPVKPVAPTVVQAKPGASTTLMSKRAAPPSHQQTGLPKIAASPAFVDGTTLLPQRGPQGAATRSAKVVAAEPLPPTDPR